MNSARFVFVVPLALLTNACGVQAYARGAASYTSSPATADHSGALPLRTLVCIDPNTRDYARSVAIRLGDGCSLVGEYEAHSGRGASPGGVGRLRSDGECALPTADGSMPIRVTTSTFQMDLDAVNLTVGGKTPDGRYVTYRFTGALGANVAEDPCKALLRAPQAAL
jgi:hypothetical protein